MSVNFCTGTLTDRRARALPNHDVELVVLHRGIQNLLDGRIHAVNLVDEQDLPLLEVGQDGREVARLLQHGAGRGPHRHTHLVANDVGQGRLAQAGRSVEQHVIDRLVSLPRRLNRHLQVFPQPILADVVIERLRPETCLVLRVLISAHRTHDSRIGHDSGINAHAKGVRARRAQWASSRSACRSTCSSARSSDAFSAPSIAFSASGR